MGAGGFRGDAGPRISAIRGQPDAAFGRPNRHSPAELRRKAFPKTSADTLIELAFVIFPTPLGA
jgi:hypothetical protein